MGRGQRHHRPAPVPPQVTLPPAAEAPKLAVERQILYSASLGGGPLLVSRSGRLEAVNPAGTDRRVLGQNVRARAVVGPDRAGALVALDSGVVTRVEARRAPGAMSDNVRSVARL